MRRIGISLVVIGLIAFAVSLFADVIGLSDDPGFQVGPRQASGIALGLVVALVGLVLVVRERRS